MIKIFFITFSFIGLAHLAVSQKVRLPYDESLPQASYAAARLEKSLLERGYLLRKDGADYMVSLALVSGRLSGEAYSIQTDGNRITITGGNERGIIYGSLSLVEDLRKGIPLQKIQAGSESAHLPFRALKFNHP